jgi:Fe-S-cluster containining protein
MNPAYQRKIELAQKQLPETRKFLNRLKKISPKDLDEVVAGLHDKAFTQIDCLQCGNCCRTLGPRLTDRDIQEMASALRIKPAALTQKYLHIDEDRDFVFAAMPCPFIDNENLCGIYSSRPRACAEYPHTDRRRFVQLLDLTLKNLSTCPAVCDIVAELKRYYK